MIKKVLAPLERHDLAISLKKSLFHVDRIEFLGYIVGKDIVTMGKKKVESLLSWKAPWSVNDFQTFFRFCKFLPKIDRKLLQSMEINNGHVKDQRR